MAAICCTKSDNLLDIAYQHVFQTPSAKVWGHTAGTWLNFNSECRGRESKPFLRIQGLTHLSLEFVEGEVH